MDEAELEAFARLGYDRVPEMVEELAAVARRGNPIAAIAADGSGKELLYGLAAADRCDPESPALQALVLSPTREAAFRAAEALHALGLEGGLAALAWLPWGEAAEGSEERPFAQLVAGRPVELLPEVRSGRLKLGELRLLVLDGVSALEETGQWESVEAILDTLPADAQKIAVDARLSGRLKALVTHQLGRGKKWPPELFQPGAGRGGGASAGGAAGGAAGSGGPGDGGARLLVAAADAAERRIDLLAGGLARAAEGGDGAESAFVHCPDAPTAHRVAAGLAARGFALTDEPGEPGVLVAWGEEETAGGAAALVGLPSGLPELTARLGPARVRLAVVGTAELPQLRILAERAGWSLEAVPEAAPADSRDGVERFRDAVRRRLEGWDDDAELLVLEPLLEEHGAARVAAALGGLLRQRGPAEEAGAGGGAREAAGREGAGERAAASGRAGGGRRGGREARDTGGRKRPAERSEEPGTRGTWFRLYISAGSRDGVGPNDIVGAITGETGAVGAQIGRIDVRSSYTLVDVDSQIADQVMAGLSGATIKGREVVARPDRES